MTFARRLIAGSMLLTLSNGSVRLLQIITIPILTSLLSPQIYGVAALFVSALSFASVFALAGIDVSYARTFHSKTPPNGVDVEHFCWRFAVFSALVTAGVSGMIWVAVSTRSAEFNSWLATLLVIGIVLSVGHTMTLTRARLDGRYKVMATATFVSGIVSSAASIGIAFWYRKDELALILPMLLSYLIPLLLLGSPSFVALTKRSSLSRNEGIPLIMIGLAAIVTAPMHWLLSSSDRWFLHHFHGAEAVGVYSIGYSVAIIGSIFNGAVMSVWLPEASREYEQDRERAKLTLGRLMSRLIAAMAIIWLMVTAAGGDLVRLLANERYHSAANYVPFIAGGVFFYGISQLALYGLVLVKQFKWAAFWWLVGGIICLFLNFLLVPRYGGYGAAVTQSVSFAFLAIVILATSQSKYRVHVEWVRLVLAASLIVFAGIVSAGSWHANPAISLVMKFPFGFVVAAITSWVLAPDWCNRGLVFLRRGTIP